MYKRTFALLAVLVLWSSVAWGQGATATPKPILAGPLARLDIKDAKVEAVRGKPRGTLNIGLHFGLDPGWLDPLQYYGPAFHFYYLIHDALIKPMPQGEFTYSLAEHAEMTADFTKAAFRLRPGLKFHDGRPLTTAEVKWTYENYKGLNFKVFRDKLDHFEIVDDRTIIFHFKEPYAVCGGPASYICEPKIESLWAKHEASIDPAERERLSKEIQRIIVEGYYLVPLYLNPFVHAVTPKVLPEGEAVRHYWDTVNAPFPWPWEVWEVKG